MKQSAAFTARPAARRRAPVLLALALVLLLSATLSPDGAGAQATTSAGWVKQNTGSYRSLSAVAFADSAHGWAVGESGVILATANGGATWNAQDSGSSQNLYGVAFGDSTHGCAVGEGGVILATANGGATWSTRRLGKLRGALRRRLWRRVARLDRGSRRRRPDAPQTAAARGSRGAWAPPRPSEP